jgi:hypothetical protein
MAGGLQTRVLWLASFLKAQRHDEASSQSASQDTTARAADAVKHLRKSIQTDGCGDSSLFFSLVMSVRPIVPVKPSAPSRENRHYLSAMARLGSIKAPRSRRLNRAERPGRCEAGLSVRCPAVDIYFTPRCANRLARSGGGEDRKFLSACRYTGNRRKAH